MGNSEEQGRINIALSLLSHRPHHPDDDELVRLVIPARGGGVIPWARRLIDKGRAAGDIPIYGSPEWEALDDTDPRKVAACVRAAEAWRSEGEPDAIRAQVLEDLEQAERYFAHRIREASKDVSDAHDWAAATRRVTWAELQRRRAPFNGSEAA